MKEFWLSAKGGLAFSIVLFTLSVLVGFMSYWGGPVPWVLGATIAVLVGACAASVLVLQFLVWLANKASARFGK